MAVQLNDVQTTIRAQFWGQNRMELAFGFKLGRRMFKPVNQAISEKNPNQIMFNFGSGSVLKGNYEAYGFGINYDEGPDTYTVTIRHAVTNPDYKVFEYKTDGIYFDSLVISDMLRWAENNWTLAWGSDVAQEEQTEGE